MGFRTEDILTVHEPPMNAPAWEGDDSGPLERLEAEITSLMRSAAESRRDATDAAKGRTDEVRTLLLQILEVADSFDRVFRSIQQKQDAVTPQMKVWIGNFRAVGKLVEKLLRDAGVTAIQNLDQGFDPEWHRATETVADPSRENGAIVEEIRKGYVWRNEILRKAEVVIVRNE